MDAVCLRALQHRFPTVATALAEIAHLRGILTLPRGTIHVVSDVHGEFQKLEHILRNGSGSLRPLVERTFGGQLDARAAGHAPQPRSTTRARPGAVISYLGHADASCATR